MTTAGSPARRPACLREAGPPLAAPRPDPTRCAQVLAALRPLQARLYSISSSQLEAAARVAVTVAVVRYASLGRPRIGVTSTFAAERVRVRPARRVVHHVLDSAGTGAARARAPLGARRASGRGSAPGTALTASAPRAAGGRSGAGVRAQEPGLPAARRRQPAHHHDRPGHRPGALPVRRPSAWRPSLRTNLFFVGDVPLCLVARREHGIEQRAPLAAGQCSLRGHRGCGSGTCAVSGCAGRGANGRVLSCV